MTFQTPSQVLAYFLHIRARRPQAPSTEDAV